MIVETARLIQASSDFEHIATRFSHDMTMRWRDLSANRSVFDNRARAVVLVHAVALGSDGDVLTEDIGFSVNSFKDLMAATGVMSRGRAGALLGYLRLLRFVRADKESGPGKRLVLKNSGEIVQFVAPGWEISYRHSSALLSPEVRLPEPYAPERRIIEFARYFVLQFADGYRPFADLEAFQQLWRMRGGMSVLLDLFARHDGDAISTRALSKQFSIPRSQVNKILKMGLSSGHLVIRPDQVALSPRMYEEVKTAIARYFAMILIGAHGEIRPELRA